MKSWLSKTSKIMSQTGVSCLEFMIKNSVADGLQFIKKHQKCQPFPVQDVMIVITLCRILDAFFDFMGKNGGFGKCEFPPLILVVLYLTSSMPIIHHLLLSFIKENKERKTRNF